MNPTGINTNPMPYYTPLQSYYGFGQVQPPYIPPAQTSRPQPTQPATQMTYIPNYISGRVVNGPDEITPQEIPMDGTLSLFPQQDQSCIFAKSWNADGTIKTIRYVPEVMSDPSVPEDLVPNVSDILQDVIKRLDRIEKNTTYHNRKPYNQNNRNQIRQQENRDTEVSNE